MGHPEGSKRGRKCKKHQTMQKHAQNSRSRHMGRKAHKQSQAVSSRKPETRAYILQSSSQCALSLTPRDAGLQAAPSRGSCEADRYLPAARGPLRLTSGNSKRNALHNPHRRCPVSSKFHSPISSPDAWR